MPCERENYIFERALFGREINAGPNLKRERDRRGRYRV